jgi:hypothetical protein
MVDQPNAQGHQIDRFFYQESAVETRMRKFARKDRQWRDILRCEREGWLTRYGNI